MSEWKWYHKPKHKTRGDTPVVSYGRLTAATFLILGIVCMLVSGVLMVQWATDKSVPVKQEFTTHINSAYYLYDPGLIIQRLNRSLQGIENLGLKPRDSGAAFSWDVNYHHSVQFCIDQIESTIEYANALIEWKEQSYYNSSVIENVNDLYNEKLTHLREKADNADIGTIEIAYCFNNKAELFWYPYGALIGLTSLIVAVIGAAVRMSVH